MNKGNIKLKIGIEKIKYEYQGSREGMKISFLYRKGLCVKNLDFHHELGAKVASFNEIGNV